MAALAHLVGIDAEHAVVVRRAVSERLVDLGAHLRAVRLARAARHAYAAERVDAAHERSARLQSDDELVLLIHVCGGISEQRTDRIGVDAEHTAVLALQLLQTFEHRVQLFRARSGSGEETLIPGVGRIIVPDEIGDVDGVAPFAFYEVAVSFHYITPCKNIKGSFDGFIKVAQSCPDGRHFPKKPLHGVCRLNRQSRFFFSSVYMIPQYFVFVNRL